MCSFMFVLYCVYVSYVQIRIKNGFKIGGWGEARSGPNREFVSVRSCVRASDARTRAWRDSEASTADFPHALLLGAPGTRFSRASFCFCAFGACFCCAFCACGTFGRTPHFGVIVMVQSVAILTFAAKFATGSSSGG